MLKHNRHIIGDILYHLGHIERYYLYQCYIRREDWRSGYTYLRPEKPSTISDFYFKHLYKRGL